MQRSSYPHLTGCNSADEPYRYPIADCICGKLFLLRDKLSIVKNSPSHPEEKLDHGHRETTSPTVDQSSEFSCHIPSVVLVGDGSMRALIDDVFRMSSIAGVNCTIPNISDLLVHTTDQIVRSLSPSIKETGLRQGTIDYVKSVMRNAFGSFILPIGSSATNTFLPNNDINLTSFISSGLNSSWFIRANNALCTTALIVDVLNSEETHRIERVSLYHSSEETVIKAVVDGFQVQVSVNCLASVYTNALLEKIDKFVGNDHLFKRSLILLKAWFTFEVTQSALMSKCTFPTSAVEVLLLWIFNWAGKFISSPLQALDYFLSYFSRFNWTTWAITMFGPVSSLDLTEDDTIPDVMLLPVLERNSAEIVKPSEEISIKSLDPVRIGYLPIELLLYYHGKLDSQDLSSENIFKKFAGKTSADGEDTVRPVADDDQFTISFPHSVPGERPPYTCGAMNVMDHIRKGYCLTTSVDARYLQLFQEAVNRSRASLEQVCGALKHDLCGDVSEDGAEHGDLVSPRISNVLTGVEDTLLPYISSFVKSQRSAVQKLNGMDCIEGSWNVCLDIVESSLEESTRLAELVLFSKPDPGAFIFLVRHILEQHGPIPVGEVGKSIQDITGNGLLTQVLKRQYDGLKRLIEEYGQSIFISNDHPFNPRVYLDRQTCELTQRSSSSDSTSVVLESAYSSHRDHRGSVPKKGDNKSKGGRGKNCKNDRFVNSDTMSVASMPSVPSPHVRSQRLKGGHSYPHQTLTEGISTASFQYPFPSPVYVPQPSSIASQPFYSQHLSHTNGSTLSIPVYTTHHNQYLQQPGFYQHQSGYKYPEYSSYEQLSTGTSQVIQAQDMTSGNGHYFTQSTFYNVSN